MAKEFSDAPEVEKIAEKLIELFKAELLLFEIPIKYIFSSENPKHAGVEAIALARKITGLTAYLAGIPDGLFLMEVGIPAWEGLSINQKIAVVHHELCHFGIDDWGKPVIIPHDIEEFSEVAAVHGAYFDRLSIFADAVEKGNSDTTERDEIIDEILKNL